MDPYTTRLLESLPANLPKPSSFPQPAEVIGKSRKLVGEIFDCWNTLHQITLRHETKIRRRWMKKTKEQRKKTLLAAWPEMPARHRPDFQELSSPRARTGSANQDAFKWPYINQEDLLQGRYVLLFLNARGRHLPHVFAHADLEGCHVGVTSQHVQRAFLNEYTMYLSGEKTQEEYGRLVSWHDDDMAATLLFDCLQFNPGDGLLVLEIQAKIYGFLLEFCYQMFHDIPRDELVSAEYPEQPEPPAITTNDTSYAQLSTVAAEAPYRVPAKIDPLRLVTLIQARRDAAEDHIWDLREDPGYFASTVSVYAQHRQESLLDTNGKRHPHDNDDVFWNRVIAGVVIQAYMSFVMWDVLLKDSVAVVEQFRAVYGLDREQRLPEKLETAMLNLSFAAEKVAKGPIMLLKTIVPASPPLRERWVREPQQEGTSKIQTHTKGAVGADPLVGLFSWLFNDQQVFLARLWNMVDELQRCAENDPAQKNRMSSMVAETFSDLALVAQVLKQVNTYYPWAAAFENRQAEAEKELSRKYDDDMKDAQIIYRGLQENTFPNLARVVVPVAKRLHYPVDKAYNASNVEAMRQSEVRLDLIWKILDDHLAKQSKKTLHQLFLGRVGTEREIRRTPVWTPPAPKEPKRPQQDDGETLPTSFDTLALGPEKGSRPVIEPPRAKIKTKGAPRVESAASEVAPQEAEEVESPLVFALSKRAWKVFSTLFHTASETDHVGEVAWPEFLHAMTAVGFVAEKLYGSVWQFSPSKLDVENSIHIHELHPLGKIPFRTARRIGRRLFRSYGLTGESFTLAG